MYQTLQEMHDAGLIPPIEWLWPDWIPLAMLSLLTGEGGVGKSLLALDLAERIVRGTTFPDGAPIPRPGSPVVYVAAEAAPRIHSTGLHLMLPPPDALFFNLNDRACRERLSRLVASLRPSLVVVDSLATVLPPGQNHPQDVRLSLAFLSRLAREFDCALLFIQHLRKRSELPSSQGLNLDELQGEEHVVAAARSVLGLSIVQRGPETDGHSLLRLEVLKSNLARCPQPIGVQKASLAPARVTLRYRDTPVVEA